MLLSAKNRKEKTMKKSSLLYFSLRLYGKSFVAGLLAAIMNIVVLAAYESQLVNFAVMVLCYILIGVLIYTEAWSQGFSDINRDRNEKRPPDMLKGLKASLIASIPVFLLTVSLFMVKFSLINESYIALYRILNTVYQPLCLSLLPSTLTALEIPFVNYLLIALTSLTLPFFAAPAYYFGYNDYQLKNLLVYKKHS